MAAVCLSEDAITSLMPLFVHEVQQSRKPVVAASANPGVRRAVCTAPWLLCTLSPPLVLKPHLGSLQLSLSSSPRR